MTVQLVIDLSYYAQIVLRNFRSVKRGLECMFTRGTVVFMNKTNAVH